MCKRLLFVVLERGYVSDLVLGLLGDREDMDMAEEVGNMDLVDNHLS